MANENYDRIAIELTNLRRRVSELEHSNQDLQRKYYEMKTYVRGLEMEAFLKDYKPKEKK